MGFYSDFAGHYERIFPFRRAVLDYVAARLPAAGSWLDVGCGGGGLCGALAAAGRPALGIDLDPGMVAAAAAAHPAATFRVLDMADLDLLPAAACAGVGCLGNVLPHLPAAAMPDFLAAVRRRLRPAGRWILQMVHYDPLLGRRSHDFPVLEFPAEGLRFFRGYRDIAPEGLRFVTRLEQRGRVLFAGEARLTPLTVARCLALHRAAGLTLLEHHADFAGSPFLPEASGGMVLVFAAG